MKEVKVNKLRNGATVGGSGGCTAGRRELLSNVKGSPKAPRGAGSHVSAAQRGCVPSGQSPASRSWSNTYHRVGLLDTSPLPVTFAAQTGTRPNALPKLTLEACGSPGSYSQAGRACPPLAQRSAAAKDRYVTEAALASWVRVRERQSSSPTPACGSGRQARHRSDHLP
jgi:hypothetical protein